MRCSAISVLLSLQDVPLAIFQSMICTCGTTPTAAPCSQSCDITTHVDMPRYPTAGYSRNFKHLLTSCQQQHCSSYARCCLKSMAIGRLTCARPPAPKLSWQPLRPPPPLRGSRSANRAEGSLLWCVYAPSWQQERAPTQQVPAPRTNSTRNIYSGPSPSTESDVHGAQGGERAGSPATRL